MRWKRRQRCSDFQCCRVPKRVLLVGAERPDEFRDAMKLLRRGHEVTVVNPRVTEAARVFRSEGGSFIPARVEQLPRALGDFDLICENYPYPSGRQSVPAKAFAQSRLARLARGGRWILFTESPRYARELKAAAGGRTDIGEFSLLLSRVPEDLAPASFYPPSGTRIRLTFERRP